MAHDATNSRIDLAELSPVYDRYLSTASGSAPDPHDLLGQSHSNPNSYRRDDTPIVLGAGDMDVVDGAPSIKTIHNRWIGWALPDNGTNRVAGIINVPYQWNALDVELMYTTLTGNSGTTRVRDRRLAPNEGENLFESDSQDTYLDVSVSAEHLAIATLTKDAPVSASDSSSIGPGPMLLAFQRNDLDNTLAGDLLMIALVLRKAG